MLKVSVRMLMMSHLSDVQEVAGSSSKELIAMMHMKINFVKFLMLKYHNNEVEVDHDVEWEKFINRKKS